jgi:hypothetical protein
MIYLRLAGGLGNQLYQIAAAGLMCASKGQKVVFFEGGLNSYSTPRFPDGVKFVGAKPWIVDGALDEYKTVRLMSERFRCGRWLPRFGISDRNYWSRLVSDIPGNLFMDGYFQIGWNSNTIASAIDLISDRIVEKKFERDLDFKKVVIHIRGGDFLRHPEFQVVGFEFYEKAVVMAIKRGYTFFSILSDDEEYAHQMCGRLKRRFSDEFFNVFPRGNSVVDDFEKLRMARARIIGNSTFAWWASALGVQGSVTWSCTKITKYISRDHVLENEIPVEIVGF